MRGQPSSRPRRSLRRFSSHSGGLAAIEFAFIAPMLIFLYFGAGEISQLLMAQRRASQASVTLADLITQDTQIGDEEMLQLYEAACAIMRPFPVRSVRIRTSSASLSADNKVLVDWSDDNGRGLVQLADAQDLTAGSPVKVGTPLKKAGESVVIAEVQYDFVSPLNFFLRDASHLSIKSEVRPRRSEKVLRVAESPFTSDKTKVCSTPAS